MKKRILLSTVALSAIMLLNSCGGGGGNSTTDTTTSSTETTSSTTDTTASSRANRTVTGSIDTSTLTTADKQALTQSSTQANGRLLKTTGNELVKLYRIDSNGVEVDTNITCTIANKSYTCPNVEGGKEYIARYVRDLGNGKVLEFKAPVTVPTDSDPQAVKIDPITTMVVGSIMKAVEKAIVGVTADSATIDKIMKEVKKAITETINTLVAQGTITIPSMAVTADFATIKSASKVTTTNSNLDDTAGIVTSNSSVSDTINAIKNTTEGAAFATLSNADKVTTILKALGWYDNVPGWVSDLSTGEYDNVPATGTFRWLFEKNQLKAKTAEKLNFDQNWDLKLLKDLGYTASEVSAFATKIANNINSKITDGTLFKTMQDDLIKIHQLKAKTTLTAEEKKFLATTDPIIAEVYGSEFVNSATFDTKLENMGQLLLLVKYLDIGEGEIKNQIVTELQNKLEADSKKVNEVMLNRVIRGLFADNTGEFIPALIGQNGIAKYDKLSIGRMHAIAERHWDGQKEITALRFEADVDKIKWMQNGGQIPDGVTATLTYPIKAGDTATTDIPLQTSPDGKWKYYGIDPYQSETPITDFASGDYTVTFNYNGESATKTRKFVFIENAQRYAAKLTKPEGQPIYNPEWDKYRDFQNGTDGWKAGTPTKIIDAFNTFQQESQKYWEKGIPTFAPDTDSNGDGTNDTLKEMIIKWKAPKIKNLKLPKNVKLAYSVNVRLFKPTDTNGDGVTDWKDCQGDKWQKCNIDIYNSWDIQGEPITTTSIVLPVALEVNQNDSTIPDAFQQERYEVNVNVEFIDKRTHESISHGGGSNAQFRVGTPTVLSGNEKLTFNGTISIAEYSQSKQLPDHLKVALIGEKYGDKPTREVLALGDINTTATDTTFTISTTWDNIKDYASHNSNIQIIGFNDLDNSNTWDEPDWENFDPKQQQGIEDSYWLKDSWVHMEGAGDKIIRVDRFNPTTNETNTQSYRLKQNTDITINGLKLEVF